MEALVDPSHFENIDENNLKSMARFIKKMSKKIGKDLDEAMASLEGGSQNEGRMSIPNMD